MSSASAFTEPDVGVMHASGFLSRVETHVTDTVRGDPPGWQEFRDALFADLTDEGTVRWGRPRHETGGIAERRRWMLPGGGEAVVSRMPAWITIEFATAPQVAVDRKHDELQSIHELGERPVLRDPRATMRGFRGPRRPSATRRRWVSSPATP